MKALVFDFFRRLVIVALPIPVIAASMMLSAWAQFDQHAGARRNRVHHKSIPLTGDDERTRDLSPTNELSKACRELASRWQSQLNAIDPPGSSSCHTLVRAPFVLAGDLPAEDLDSIYEQTIRPAAAALRRAYFQQTPSEPISMLLFAHERTYRQYPESLFGKPSPSVYGYYRPVSRTVIINLSAGEGTIVHELTHALMDFDYPDAPIWINEGLASMYEECELAAPFEYGIRPLENWRLPILQQSLVDGTLSSSQGLMELERLTGPREAVHYAHARYLCMYLQEVGILAELYHRMRDGQASADHFAEATLLVRRSARESMDEAFQRWVMSKAGFRIARNSD